MDHKNSSYTLSIITPTKIVFEDTILSLTARTSSGGDIGIRRGHEPAVLILEDGLVTINTPEKQVEYMVQGGTLLVQPNKIIVLAQFSSLPEDVERLQQEYTTRLEESYLREERAGLEIQRAELALHRSLIQSRGKFSETPLYYEES